MINKQRAADKFIEYVRIDSETHHEGKMYEHMIKELKDMGLSPETDDAGIAAESDGNNIFCYIDGDEKYEPLMFSAHIDTVTPGKGIKPVIENGYIKTDGKTILGADDKSGVAAIMEAARSVLENNAPHRPVQLVFTIREESGLNGSRNLDYSKIKAKKGFVLDASNDTGKIVSSAPGQIRLYADVYGKRSHAGSDPEKGVSAIQAAAAAVSRMKLQRIDEETTANIGTLSCIGETNVVQDHVSFAAEARSKNQEKLLAQQEHMIQCLKDACDEFGAKLEYKTYQSYKPYAFSDDHPLVQLITAKCKDMGIEPWTTYTGGGTDANNFNAHGIETLVFACGMEKEHTTEEQISIKNLEDTAELVYRLMTI